VLYEYSKFQKKFIHNQSSDGENCEATASSAAKPKFNNPGHNDIESIVLFLLSIPYLWLS
jgi:hypothetical protein